MTTPSPSAPDPHTDPTRAARWGVIDRETLTGTATDAFGNRFEVRGEVAVRDGRKVLWFIVAKPAGEGT